ncbi:MAG: hypothetical protein N0A16_07865 [Blastocatellia bacterium]|nr:hypothetical protein [Blastocatellia bacterium]MCS7157630.1 hypothetical protein [Blastocatellia bacterium]MCX7751895.1 hypothetical protein [Blastocatellia bacterium]MDW8167001.1 hypothetical protein [Acidobacteriota bacterium]MDW8257105.1 hypothetical protein [Acidobacteriota bacterium]
MRRRSVGITLSLIAGLAALGLPSKEEPRAAKRQEPTLELAHLSVNDHEDIVYTTPEGIFLKSGPRPLRLVAVGEEAPMTRGARFRAFGPLRINRRGTVVFHATVDGGEISSGLFVVRARARARPLVLAGQPAPQTRGYFSAFERLELTDRIRVFGLLPVPETEVVVFRALVREGERTRSGLFFVLLAGGDVGALVLQGQPIGVRRGRYRAFGDFSTLSIDAFPLGTVRIAFIAELEGDEASEGIFLMTLFPQLSEFARPIALSGEDAPGGPGLGRFDQFRSVSLNRNELAFVATLTGERASEGIFQAITVGPLVFFQSKVMQGGNVPFGPGRFERFGELSSNNQEQLVFRATVVGRDAPEGLYLVSLGPLTITTTVAEIGDRAPERDGRIARIGEFVLLENGKTYFQASLTDGDAREAIYIGSARRIFPTGIQR